MSMEDETLQYQLVNELFNNDHSGMWEKYESGDFSLSSQDEKKDIESNYYNKDMSGTYPNESHSIFELDNDFGIDGGDDTNKKRKRIHDDSDNGINGINIYPSTSENPNKKPRMMEMDNNQKNSFPSNISNVPKVSTPININSSNNVSNTNVQSSHNIIQNINNMPGQQNQSISQTNIGSNMTLNSSLNSIGSHPNISSPSIPNPNVNNMPPLPPEISPRMERSRYPPYGRYYNHPRMIPEDRYFHYIRREEEINYQITQTIKDRIEENEKLIKLMQQNLRDGRHSYNRDLMIRFRSNTFKSLQDLERLPIQFGTSKMEPIIDNSIMSSYYWGTLIIQNSIVPNNQNIT